MSAGIVPGLRLIRVRWSLSRHGALFPLQSFGAPAWVVCFLRLAERRVGDRASRRTSGDGITNAWPHIRETGTIAGGTWGFDRR